LARRRRSVVVFVLVGLAVAAVLAFFVAPHANPNPDGLSEVAADKGIDASRHPSAVDDSPLAGYAVKGVHDEGLSKGLSGLIGVAVTFAIGAGAVWLVRRRRGGPSLDTTSPPGQPAGVAPPG
jgi:cobalt/nickel transport system permease protein